MGKAADKRHIHQCCTNNYSVYLQVARHGRGQRVPTYAQLTKVYFTVLNGYTCMATRHFMGATTKTSGLMNRRRAASYGSCCHLHRCPRPPAYIGSEDCLPAAPSAPHPYDMRAVQTPSASSIDAENAADPPSVDCYHIDCALDTKFSSATAGTPSRANCCSSEQSFPARAARTPGRSA